MRQTDGQRRKREWAEGDREEKKEAAVWGRIRIRLSPGDSSSSRINALKFFGFTLNGFKEIAKAALWLPGTRVPQLAQALGNRKGSRSSILGLSWRT